MPWSLMTGFTGIIECFIRQDRVRSELDERAKALRVAEVGVMLTTHSY